MGVGSNLIVRDGGLRAVVIRLGRAFADIGIDGDRVTAGAAALDSRVAQAAARRGAT
jgi:UDP-N-acetylmuramate dehydrogenase